MKFQLVKRQPALRLIVYIGICVSGVEEAALDLFMPLLEKVAAKGVNGNPCVGRASTGSAGHHIMMIHKRH